MNVERNLVYAYERYLADFDPTPLDSGDDYVSAMSFEDFKDEYYEADPQEQYQWHNN